MKVSNTHHVTKKGVVKKNPSMGPASVRESLFVIKKSWEGYGGSYTTSFTGVAPMLYSFFKNDRVVAQLIAGWDSSSDRQRYQVLAREDSFMNRSYDGSDGGEAVRVLKEVLREGR